MRRLLSFVSILLLLLVSAHHASAVELMGVNEKNWHQVVPAGKEVDCILGDFVLRNDNIVAVLAQPLAGRDANLTVRDVGGCIIDLSGREDSNDQLGAYYPGGHVFRFTKGHVSSDGGPWRSLDEVERCDADAIRVRFEGTSDQSELQLSVVYGLSAGDVSLTVEQTYLNPTKAPVPITMVDSIRADRSFEFEVAQDQRLFTADDLWWKQAYGLLLETDGYRLDVTGLGRGRPMVQYVSTAQSAHEEKKPAIQPQKTAQFQCQLLGGRHRMDILSAVSHLHGQQTAKCRLQIQDEVGPVRDAQVTVLRDNVELGRAHAGPAGILEFHALPGSYEVQIASASRESSTIAVDLAVEQMTTKTVDLVVPGYVRGEITDAEGRPIAAKVEFKAREPAVDPFFGPDTYVWEVHNLIYTEDGTFRQAIAPGTYDVIVSHGPEFDAEFLEVEVERGKAARIVAALKRSVDTTGWVSADFHSHSSPSGDNTSSQLGRVLNLLAEHIEFAPCTEHNRISSYVPHLRRLDATGRLATCCGIELTGQPLPINHQNAFPLQMHEHHQDGGGPRTSFDPFEQIQRLAWWDDESEKVVQGNHPNIPHIYGDRDADGNSDEGHRKMFGLMDVIEVHPPHTILLPPVEVSNEHPFGNTMFHWLQLLNLGYRLPGVVNTDAHYTYHGSGWLRNYVASTTDDPAQIDVMDMVHACEHGNVVMTNGPFLEVRVTAAGQQAIPGDEIAATDDSLQLSIRVQCPNWFEIDRVQVLINGKADDSLNFVRRKMPDKFHNGSVKFDQKVPLSLVTDSHVIVVAIGEKSRLGLAAGPGHADDLPVAVSNPIFVDVDGGGFQANGDLLGATLP